MERATRILVLLPILVQTPTPTAAAAVHLVRATAVNARTSAPIEIRAIRGARSAARRTSAARTTARVSARTRSKQCMYLEAAPDDTDE